MWFYCDPSFSVEENVKITEGISADIELDNLLIESGIFSIFSAEKKGHAITDRWFSVIVSYTSSYLCTDSILI